MYKISLEALARELRERVDCRGDRKVASRTVYGGHEKILRQTLMVMGAGSRLSDHEYPGDSTIQVMSGRVRLYTDTDSWQAQAGSLLIIPEERHGLEAVEDCAFLITVAKPQRASAHHGRGSKLTRRFSGPAMRRPTAAVTSHS